MNQPMREYNLWTMRVAVESYKAFLWRRYGRWIQKTHVSKTERKGKTLTELKELRLRKWMETRFAAVEPR